MEVNLTLMSLTVGSRLLVRSRKDWRFAAVSRVSAEKIVLTVSSPSGRNYRMRPEASREIFMEGLIPILPCEEPDDWRENFCRYDCRW